LNRYKLTAVSTQSHIIFSQISTKAMFARTPKCNGSSPTSEKRLTLNSAFQLCFDS